MSLRTTQFVFVALPAWVVVLCGVPTRGDSVFQAAYQAGAEKLHVFPPGSGHLTHKIDFAGARADYGEALRAAQSAGQRTAAHLGLADTRLHDPGDTDYPAIREEFGKVLALGETSDWPRSPDDLAEARLGIVETHLQEQNYELARQALADARERASQPPFAGDIALVAAKLHIQNRDLEAARAELRSVLGMAGLRDEEATKRHARRTLVALDVASALRPDHPRLFFNADSWPEIRDRALGRERAAFEEMRLGVAGITPDEVTRGDWGVHLMKAAFVVRVTREETLLEAIKLMLQVTAAEYRSRRAYSTRSCPRICWLAALDWVWNDLTPSEREALIAPMIGYAYDLYTEDKLRGRLRHQPWYYERNAWWYAGVVLLNGELDDVQFAQVLDVLGQGYEHNRALITEYADRGGDDGAWHLNLEYAFYELPGVIWPFMYTLSSATGLEPPDAWLNVGVCVDYVLRNLLGVERGRWALRHFGYSRSWHNGGFGHDLMVHHLAHFLHFYGPSHPVHAGIAHDLRQRILAEAGPGSGSRFPVERFLVTGLERAPPPELPTGLPMARHFENVGVVLMSSGWGPDDTRALFACGGSAYTSEHLDAAHFAIWKRGFLALDAGTRGAGAHSANYWSQTVAHNCVLIRRPGEVLPGAVPGAGSAVAPNSGGQCEKTSAATVLAFESGELYSYVASDATTCYSPRKCRQMVRQFIYLPRAHFVVFDRVSSTDANYAKRWLLHTANEPVLDGMSLRADAEQGRIFCRTLCPADAAVSKVGGPGKEFMADGVNWPIPEAWNYWRHHDGKVPDAMGRWRVEVSPGLARENDCFLHLLQVSDQSRQHMSGANAVESADAVELTFSEGERTYRLALNKTGEVGGEICITERDEVLINRALASGVMPQKGLALDSGAAPAVPSTRSPLPGDGGFEPANPTTYGRKAGAPASGGSAAELEPVIGEGDLFAALADDDWRVQRHAARALGLVGESAVKPLVAKLQDADRSVRRWAAVALGEIGDARAVDPLIQALADSCRLVCLEAHASLVQITGRNVHVELDWPADTIRQYRQPIWQAWRDKAQGAR